MVTLFNNFLAFQPSLSSPIQMHLLILKMAKMHLRQTSVGFYMVFGSLFYGRLLVDY